MASYKDIRQETGLALSTISKFFNNQPVREANRIAIEAAVSKLQFQPNGIARSLKLNRTGTVGVLLPALDSDFHLSIIAGAEAMLRSVGMSTIVAASPSPERDAVGLLTRQMVDGIIAVPSQHDIPPLQSAARLRPVVLVDRRPARSQLDAVLLDNEAAGRTAIRHLLDHGHRRIALLGGESSISSMAGRMRGSLQEMRDAGLDDAAVLVARVALTRRAAARAAVSLLTVRPRPTAIFAMNVDLTLGAIAAVTELGLQIPHDLSLVGFDGLIFARVMSPTITVVAQPTQEIAEAAAGMMRDHLAVHGPPLPHPVVTRLLAPHLVVGGSVRRPTPD